MANEREPLNDATWNWIAEHKADLKEKIEPLDESKFLSNLLNHPGSIKEMWGTIIQAVEKLDAPHEVVEQLKGLGKHIEGAHNTISSSDRHALTVLVKEGEKLEPENRSKLLDKWLTENKVSQETSDRMIDYLRLKSPKGSQSGPVVQPDAWYHRCGFCGVIGTGLSGGNVGIGGVCCIICIIAG